MLIAYPAKRVGGQGLIVKGKGLIMNLNACSVQRIEKVFILVNRQEIYILEVKNTLADTGKTTFPHLSENIKTVNIGDRSRITRLE